MMEGGARPGRQDNGAAQKLAHALALENETILELPQYRNFMPSQATGDLLIELVAASVQHAAHAATLLRLFGGETPEPASGNPAGGVFASTRVPSRSGARSLLQRQLERERLMARAYGSLSGMVNNATVKEALARMEQEEQGHAQALEDALAAFGPT